MEKHSKNNAFPNINKVVSLKGISPKMNASETNKPFLYAVKMRASKGDVHLSGAERLVGKEQILPVSQSLLKRALNHTNGNADAIHLKVEAVECSEVLKVPSLPVTETSAANTDKAFAVCFVRDKPSTAEFFRLFLSRNFVFSSKRFYALPSEQVARLGIPRHKGLYKHLWRRLQSGQFILC